MLVGGCTLEDKSTLSSRCVDCYNVGMPKLVIEVDTSSALANGSLAMDGYVRRGGLQTEWTEEQVKYIYFRAIELLTRSAIDTGGIYDNISPDVSEEHGMFPDYPFDVPEDEDGRMDQEAAVAEAILGVADALMEQLQNMQLTFTTVANATYTDERYSERFRKEQQRRVEFAADIAARKAEG